MSKIYHQKTTFRDTAERIYDFGNEFLICCPRCEAQAKVIPDETQYEIAKRFCRKGKMSCFHCGLNRRYEKNYSQIGGALDWYFGLSLWLQTPCCGNLLWAYNARHLAFLENYVAAELRARIPYRNGSLASRLPQWIKRAHNRPELLRSIEQLKKKL